ncbi:MAG: hypothetical protein ACKVS9_11280, partial [Phycisphaerae bacterium]
IQSARYWLSIGGYTSAIVMTEWYFGPPEITLSHLFDLVQLRFGPTMFVANEVRDVVFWAQVVLWLFGLVFCIDARLGSRAWSRGARAVMSVVCFVSLLALYGAAVEHIGVPLYDFFGDVPGLDWKLRP